MYEGQAVYSIHKTEAIDLINEYFRPYQNEMYYDESTIVELVDAIILTPIRIQKKIWATSTTEILRMENRIFTAMETKENHHQHERIIISWSRKQY